MILYFIDVAQKPCKDFQQSNLTENDDGKGQHELQHDTLQSNGQPNHLQDGIQSSILGMKSIIQVIFICIFLY